MAASLARTERTRLWRADAIVAAVAYAFCVTGAAINGATRDEADLTIGAALVLLVQCAPLTFRRTWPIAVWLVSAAATAWYGAAEWPDPLFPLGAFIALASVVECCSRRSAVVVWFISAAAAVVSIGVPGDSDGLDVWVGIVMLLFAPLLGDHQRNRNERMRQLELDVARKGEEREREVRAAQLAERAHLARELHDVVAHHVSMIVVQAEAGASAAPSPPMEAAFDAIAATGRTALSELRTLLGVLRTEGERAPVEPQPGIDAIHELVRVVGDTGIEVDLQVEGTPRALAPAVDLSAYRIVQEGLTNVLKHADARRVEVRVRFLPEQLELVVRDDGRVAAPGASPGHGLDGLRERVALLQGTLRADRRPTGGYELAVSLPAGP